MKKFVSLILAALLVFSVTAPITVFAENGPIPFDPDNKDLDLLEISSIAIMDSFPDDEEDIVPTEFFMLYPEISGFTPSKKFSGASYDLETNTLTLDNVKAKYASLILNEMGDDFKIRLIGYNEFSYIESTAEKQGGSITITGDGELVVNRTKNMGGIIIDAQETKSTLTIEETVKLKVYADKELELPAIEIYESACTDAAEIIKIGGKVKSDKPVFEKKKFNLYEQIEAYDLEWDSYDWYTFGLEKDGQYYIAEEYFNEITYDYPGTYIIHSVAYDELLDRYTLTDYAEGKPVSLDGFTQITQGEPIYDKANGFFIGYSEIAEEGDTSYKRIFDPEEKLPFDLCVDESGKKYGFWQTKYPEDGYDEVIIYNFIEHPVYGLIAVEDTTKTTLDGFTTLKIGEKEVADCYIESDLIVNNGGSVVEPKEIKSIKAKNTSIGVKITWKADKAAEKYRIYRKAEGDKKWQIVKTVKKGTTSFTDKTAIPGTKYNYTVRGYNYIGWGEYNTEGTPVTRLDIPRTTAKNMSKGIFLRWTKVAAAEKYKIYRCAEGSTEWKVIGTTKKNTFTDKTVKSGTKYYYRVRAVAGEDISMFETAGRYYLSTPKLSSVKNTASGVKVSWKKVNGAEGYNIYRKADSGKWELIGKTINNKRFNYTDETAESGNTYSYSVGAYYSKTNSTYNKTGLEIKVK